jgi:hypothetical protein
MAWIWMEPGGFGILNFIYNQRFLAGHGHAPR